MTPAGEKIEGKSTRTRERILNAAAATLAEKGYAGTRLTDIADLAGVQTPAVYYYFESREDLVEEVMRVGLERTLDYVEQSIGELPAEASVELRISTAVEAHLLNLLTESDYAKAATRNAAQVPDSIKAVLTNAQTRYNAIWRDLITDGIARGMIRDDLDPGIARMLVLGALNWTVEWWRPERDNIDEIVSTAIEIVLVGLRRSPSQLEAVGTRTTAPGAATD